MFTNKTANTTKMI